MKRFIAALLCLAIVFSFAGCKKSAKDEATTAPVTEAQFVAPTEYAATLVVEINPKVKLYLDKDLLVLAIEMLNEDAKTAFANLQVVNKGVSEAISALVETANTQKFFEKSNEIKLSVDEVKDEAIAANSILDTAKAAVDKIVKEKGISASATIVGNEAETTAAATTQAANSTTKAKTTKATTKAATTTTTKAKTGPVFVEGSKRTVTLKKQSYTFGDATFSFSKTKMPSNWQDEWGPSDSSSWDGTYTYMIDYNLGAMYVTSNLDLWTPGVDGQYARFKVKMTNSDGETATGTASIDIRLGENPGEKLYVFCVKVKNVPAGNGTFTLDITEYLGIS